MSNPLETVKHHIVCSAVHSVIAEIQDVSRLRQEDIADLVSVAVQNAIEAYESHTVSRVRLIELHEKMKLSHLRTSPLKPYIIDGGDFVPRKD
jgi:hypothetical protein